MPARNPLLQAFLTNVADVFATTALEPEAAEAVDRIYTALRAAGRVGADVRRRLPVCRHLGDALATARAASPPLARLSDSFAGIEPSLGWGVRATSGPFASDNWPEGHANATIIGPGGLEHRDDLVIGVSLLAPHVRYPDHNHAPEEVYLVLSPGRFQHGRSDWFEPGIGGTLYNAPHIRHAMASGAAPLLALWYLWVDQQPSI